VNPERLRQSPNIAIVGSSSPLGKELRDAIESSGFPAGRISLIETEEYAGLLQEFAGEIQITQILSPQAFADIDIAFFACSPEIISAYASTGANFPELTIDLTQTGRPGTLFLRGVSDPSLLRGPGYYVNPHPATIVLGRLFARLASAYTVESANVTILTPASERGSAAVDELQEQTVELLNFQTVESRIFGGQLAFNLLPEIQVARRTELLVHSQLSSLLGGRLTSAALASIQVPVFHSHGFSVFMKLKESANATDIATVLRDSGSSVVVHDEEGLSPSPVTVVGSDVVHVARIATDDAVPGTCFLWAVADNLRIAASNALQIAESLMLAPAAPR
jgi:aspartate-semialdehyde dehydrogenase